MRGIFNARKCGIYKFRRNYAGSASKLKKDISQCDDFGEPFRTPFIKPKSKTEFKFEQPFIRKSYERVPPKEERLSTEINWASYWPAAQSFRASTVPLPIRMGFPKDKQTPPPNKYGNLELMKVPNFLHLTPQAILKHCQAIKKFCTEFPIELKTDEDCVNYFPLTLKTTDFVNDGPNIRNIRARIVELTVDVNALEFDERSKDKMRLIARENYDPKTEKIKLLTECCPSRTQNDDYSTYLISAIYHESKRSESWEDLKSRQDERLYEWKGSSSELKIIQYINKIREKKMEVMGKPTQDPKEAMEKTNSLKKLELILEEMPENIDVEKLENIEKIQDYSCKWQRFMNAIENKDIVEDYGSAARKILGLPQKL